MFGSPRPRRALALVAFAALFAGLLAIPAPTRAAASTYQNPLPITIPAGGMVESCADPTVIRGQQPGDIYWYMYCTKDPLNDNDRNAGGGFNFHNIPTMRSPDLVNWTYLGDAFATPPSWGEPTSGMWAPEVQFFNGMYYLYYTMTDTKPEISGAPNCDGDNAIGVATSASPTGPWKDLGRPVVEPRYNGALRAFGQRECNFFWTFDPDVITTDAGQRYIYYGSYYGGIQARKLSNDGFTADPAAIQITIANRYEGAEVVYRDGYYYLFASAGNCCNGAATGYRCVRRALAKPHRPFRRPRGCVAARGARGRHPGHLAKRQPLGGRWPQHRVPGLAGHVVDGLPRSRCERPRLQGHDRFHPAPGAARPARLEGRLAGAARGPRPLGHAANGARRPAGQPE